MPKQTKIDKLSKVLDLFETRDEIIEAYSVSRETLTTKLEAIQKKQESEASTTQSVIDKLKGN